MNNWKDLLIIFMGVSAVFVYFIAIPGNNQIIQDWKDKEFYAKAQVDSDNYHSYTIIKNEIGNDIEELRDSIMPACFKGR